jgi:hypothetical protein
MPQGMAFRSRAELLLAALVALTFHIPQRFLEARSVPQTMPRADFGTKISK